MIAQPGFRDMKFCFSQNTFFLIGIRSMRSPAKVGLVIIKLLTTSLVVSWRGVGDPPPPPPGITTQLSFFA